MIAETEPTGATESNPSRTEGEKIDFQRRIRRYGLTPPTSHTLCGRLVDYIESVPSRLSSSRIILLEQMQSMFVGKTVRIPPRQLEISSPRLQNGEVKFIFPVPKHRQHSKWADISDIRAYVKTPEGVRLVPAEDLTVIAGS